MAESLFVAGLDEPERDYFEGVSLGVAVTVHFPVTAGTITHIRFRTPANPTGVIQAAVFEITGPDTTPDGILLTPVLTFDAPAGGTWNTVAIPGSLHVAQGGPGGKAYRVVVYLSSGGYTARTLYFTPGGGGKLSPGGFVHAPADGDDPTGAGILHQGTYGTNAQPGTYVANTFGAGNYYVDVVFEPGGTTNVAAGAIEMIAAATDRVTVTTAQVRPAGWPVTLADVTTVAGARARSAGESLVLADAVAAPVARARRADEPLALTVTVVTTGGAVRAITESFGLTVSVAPTGAVFTRAVAQTSSTIDAVARGLAGSRTAGETVVLAATAGAGMTRAAAVSEVLPLAAAAARGPLSVARPVSAEMVVTDAVGSTPSGGQPVVAHEHSVTMTVRPAGVVVMTPATGVIQYTAGPGSDRDR